MICDATHSTCGRPRSRARPRLIWPAVQRAPRRGGRPARVPARLQARPRGHRVEAEGLALPLGALARLDQEQEPGRAGGEARSRRRLGPVTAQLVERERADLKTRAPRSAMSVAGGSGNAGVEEGFGL